MSSSAWAPAIRHARTKAADDRGAARRGGLAAPGISSCQGIQISPLKLKTGNSKRGGITPTISCGWPFSDDAAADDRGIAAEAALPETVTDHGDLGVLRRPRPSKMRPSAAGTPSMSKRVGGDAIRLHALGMSPPVRLALRYL